MSANLTEVSEVSILNRIFQPSVPAFSPETAREILEFHFDPTDVERMRELSAKARAGTMTQEESAEADHYETIGHLLNIMQSKARKSLKYHGDHAEQKTGKH